MLQWLAKNRFSLLAAILLSAAIAFNLAVLYPEVALPSPDLNDNVLHFTLVERVIEAFERGEDPTDPWVPYFVQGYPLFHYYQHLPHLATALLYQALGGLVSLFTLFKWLNYILLCIFPLSIYWSGRRLGFDPLPSALAGLTASLLSTDGLYGLDWASYVWRGYGLTTQLWGMWLLGPALAGLYVTLREGRSYAGTATLLAALLLCHTVLGYVALLSGVLFVLLDGFPVAGQRARRWIWTGLLVAIAASYFLAPFWLDRAFMNRSVWEEAGKYNAYGWEWTLRALVNGDLLDNGRFPALTLLAGLGLTISLVRWRDARYRLLALFFLGWLALYFGRPTWGVLIDLLPMGRDLQVHRLIAPVHLGAIGLIGVGLCWLWERATSAGRVEWLAGAAALTFALLAPVYWERIDYLATNEQWMQENLAAFQADGGALDAPMADLRGRSPGRVYAGRSATWGNRYTIGSVPLYMRLAVNQFDNPGYLYHALSLNADVEGYLDENNPATFDLFNLRYVVVPAWYRAPSFADFLATHGEHSLYEVDTSGYFGLVDSDWTFYGDRSTWFAATSAWMTSGWIERRQHPTVVFGPPPVANAAALTLDAAPAVFSSTATPERTPCGQIVGERVSGNTYSVEFEASRACWLLFKETFHPGWQATLDGQPAPTVMLMPSFVGVAVEAGVHRAELRYEAGALRAWLRVIGPLVLILVAVAEWQRGRWEERLRQRLALLVARPAAALRPAWQRLSAAVAQRWRQYGRWIAALLCFVLLAGLPLFQFKVMSGHDALEYLPRTVEFYRALSEGQLLPRWAPDLSGGYGQPFFIFNPPLIYYAASAWHALGFSLVASLDLACLALLALAGLGMSTLAGEFFGRAGGLAAGVAYVFAPFTLVNLYVRHALADYSAMAWIPWALWGLFRWTRAGRGEGVRYLVVVAGATALLMLSSNPVALLGVPALALYGLFLSWRAHSWRALGRGAWALGLGLGLSAFFWLPALLERDWVKVYKLLGGYLNYQNHFVYWQQLFASSWGYGLSLPGPQDGMSFGLGLVHLALLAASLVLLWRWRDWPEGSAEGRAQWGFAGVLLLLAVLLASDNTVWLWQALPLLQYIEFPWRALALTAAATAFICGLPFLALRKPSQRRWLLAAVLAGLLITGLPRARPERYEEVVDADFAPEVIAGMGLAVTTAREYEPVWAETPPETVAPVDRLIVVSGQVRVLESRLSGSESSWLIEAATPAQLRVATFYYPGWQLTVDGQPRLLTMNNPYGLIDLSIGSGIHRLEMTFELTVLRQWALWLSYGALALLGLTAVGFRRGRGWPLLGK